MEQFVLKAPAKINLFLHVNGRREDGYHLLDSLTVFADDVADILTFTPQDRFSFTASGAFSHGIGADNLVTKAARLMEETSGKTLNAHIHLEKNIPIGAGLGGGSSDAAAVIRGMEKLWGPLEIQARNALMLKLGADVPACYKNAACRFQGIGDIITEVPALPPFHMLLVWPDVHSATKDVFNARDKTYRGDGMIMPSAFGDLVTFIDFLKETANDLSYAAQSLHPSIHAACEAVGITNQCLLARMSGSGSSVFGIYETKELCTAAKERIAAQYPHWWVHTAFIPGN